MSKYISFTLIFMLGIIVGWLNPIEGPLDWTYDDYASQPAHRSPSKVAPPQKEYKEDIIENIDVDLDNEMLFIKLLRKLETYDL